MRRCYWTLREKFAAFFFMIWRKHTEMPDSTAEVRKTAPPGPTCRATELPGACARPRMSGELRSVITGASSGIGRAIAIAIASKGGFDVWLGAIRNAWRRLPRSARETARSVLVHTADLAVDGAIEALTQRLREEFTTLDMVHCAGAHSIGTVEATSLQQPDALYRINVRMPFALTQGLLPLLKLRQGQIVFINSSQGNSGQSQPCPFAATQHALKAITDSLRQEVNADGIRVSVFFPAELQRRE